MEANTISKQHQSIIDYYDNTLGDYKLAWTDKESSAFHFGFYDENATKHKDALVNTNRVLAKLVNIKKGEKVLDAGCGIGGSSFWLAKNIGAEVTGITLSQKQVDTCKKRAKEVALTNNTEFIKGDFCNTSFKDGSFDVIWSCETLSYVKDKNSFYKEAFRLLKPGGRIVIAEGIMNKENLDASEQKIIKDWVDGWAMAGLDSYDQHASYANNGGFVNLKIEDYTKYTRVSLRNLYKKSVSWLPIFKLLTKLKIRSKIQLENQVASIRQYEALEKELWYYAVITAEKPV